MNLINIIKKRRSVFPSEYRDQPLLKEELLPILNLANFAPSHRMTEPYRFQVFLKPQLSKLATKLQPLLENLPALKGKKFLKKISQSGAITFIILKKSGEVPEWEEVASMAMGVQNIWLGCADKKIGCYWSSPKWIENLNSVLNLEESETCKGFLFMGHVDSYPEGQHQKRTTFESKVQFFE